MVSLFLLFNLFWRTFRKAWQFPDFRGLAVITAAILALGTLFYHQVEGWSWLDSLYFCVVTLGTVGYGDLTPTTPQGKIFTIFYILIGIGLLVAFFSQLAQAFLNVRQEIQELREEYKQKRERKAKPPTE